MNARTRWLARTPVVPLLAGVLLLGPLAGRGQPASLAAAPRAVRVAAAQPNLFDFRDGAGQARITYATGGVDGRPHLAYTDRRLRRAYAGDQIRLARAEIGTLVSVTLEQVPDARTVTLTLLVPAVNVQGRQATIDTAAILTTQRTSIGGPALVKGALQTYRVLTLHGTASLVAF